MKEKIKHYIKEIVTFFIVMAVFMNIVSLYKSQNLTKEPLSISKVILLDLKEYKIDKSKPLLIHFWATWCPICKVEAPNIQKASKYFNVITIAVNSGSTKEIKNYMQERELSFNVVNDTNGFFAKKFNISVYPTTFIYDKNQNLIFSEVGYTSTFGVFLRMWWAGL